MICIHYEHIDIFARNFISSSPFTTAIIIALYLHQNERYISKNTHVRAYEKKNKNIKIQ